MKKNGIVWHVIAVVVVALAIAIVAATGRPYAKQTWPEGVAVGDTASCYVENVRMTRDSVVSTDRAVYQLDTIWAEKLTCQFAGKEWKWKPQDFEGFKQAVKYLASLQGWKNLEAVVNEMIKVTDSGSLSKQKVTLENPYLDGKNTRP